MQPVHIPSSAGRIIPWGNGLGTSREIILERSPLSPAPDGLLWRLATTRIDSDCPFSLYPDQDRTIVLLDGQGFELIHDARPPQKVTQRFDALSFGGDWGTRCRLLNGAVRVLNVMSARGHVASSLRTVALAQASAQRIGPHDRAMHVLQGSTLVRFPDQRQFLLQDEDTLRLEFDTPVDLTIEPLQMSATFLILEIR